jgi:hypothetical protein
MLNLAVYRRLGVIREDLDQADGALIVVERLVFEDFSHRLYMRVLGSSSEILADGEDC